MKLLCHLNSCDREQLAPLNNDEVPFQYLPEFTNFYNDYFHEKLQIVYSPELSAYLAMRLIKSKFFRFGQLLHAPISTKDGSDLASKDQLIFFNALIRFLKEKNICERLVQPHPYGILAALPPDVQSCEFGTYIIDLANQSTDQIFERFHPKYQKAVIHSQKHGAEVKFGEETFEDFYLTYSTTMQRVNMAPDSKNYFLQLRKHLGENHVTSGVVYDNGKPVGGVFFIHTNYAGFCTHAGSFGDSKLYGAVKLLHFEMMKRLKNLGVKRYDLVGVRLKNNDPSLEGIFRFKKGFGGDLKTGYLWKKDLYPVRVRLYDMLRQIKNPNDVTKDIIDQMNS
jgi:hypothetical protein